MSSNNGRLLNFMEVTGASEDVANQFLATQSPDADIQTLINLFLDEQVTPPSSAHYVPPIPQQIDTLAGDAPDPAMAPGEFLIDRMRDFRMEGELQEAMLQTRAGVVAGESGSAPQAAATSGGPPAIATSIVAAPTGPPRQVFEDLFRPPLDLLFRGEMRQARDKAVNSQRWLLVNLMNREVFNSLILNRDVWTNAAVRELIRESFILVQLDHSCAAGEQYASTYNVGVDDFPHINLIDPRTGESLHAFGGARPNMAITDEPAVANPPIDVLAFTAYLRAFLELNPNVEGFNPPAEVPDRLVRQYLDMEAEIQSAIEASLAHSIQLSPN